MAFCLLFGMAQYMKEKLMIQARKGQEITLGSPQDARMEWNSEHKSKR